jgi:hypothetical protein
MKTKISWHGDAVVAHIEKKGGTALLKFGRYVRVTARSLLKKSRQKKRSDLTQEQEDRYQSKLRQFKSGHLKNKPVRGWQSSEPGEPPRWRPNPRYGNKSPLRNLIIYHYDKEAQTVTVGPEGWRTSKGTIGVGTLEKGGTKTYRTRKGTVVTVKSKPRPFMATAMRQNFNILRSLKG